MSSFSLGTCELTSNGRNNLWRSVAAEFVGTYFLNLFPNAACTHAKGDVVLTSLTFGLTVFGLISVRVFLRVKEFLSKIVLLTFELHVLCCFFSHWATFQAAISILQSA